MVVEAKDFMPLTFGPWRRMALKISPAVLPLTV